MRDIFLAGLAAAGVIVASLLGIRWLAHDEERREREAPCVEHVMDGWTNVCDHGGHIESLPAGLVCLCGSKDGGR